MSGTTSRLVWTLVLWSFCSFGMCAAGCTLPDPQEHGQYLYKTPNPPEEVNRGYVIRVVCDEGARLRPAGDGFMTCRRGDWSPTYSCRIGCDPLPPINHGRITYRNNGNVARYRCTTPGYRLDGESDRKRYCQNFAWSGSEPQCRAIPRCPAFVLRPGVNTTRQNGRFREGLWTIGSTHNFTCRNRLQFMDLPTGTYPAIRCQSSGWNATVPICHAPTCAPLLDEIENGRTTAQNRTYNLGESIRFVCNPGYRTTSASWRVCVSQKGISNTEGVWQGVTPRCEVTECPTLKRIDDGTTISRSNEVGGTASFRCQGGYTLIGNEGLTCLSTGQWDGTVPVCENEDSAYCPTLGAPFNGRKDGDQYGKFARVRFQCNPGYVLIGSAERQCQSDGQWDGEEARCMGPKDFDDISQIAATLGESLDGLRETSLRENIVDPASLAPSSPRPRFIPLTHDYGVDLYFMFDVSKSVGEENFEKAKKFAKDLVKEIGVTDRRNSLRVGAMYFGSSAQVSFHTATFDTTDDIVNAINEIPYIGGGTNIVEALQLVRDIMIPQSEYRDKGFRTVFLITDGEATEGGSPGPVGDELKVMGIKIHCLGVSEAAGRRQLSEIASEPKREYLFFLKDYDSLALLVKAVTNQTIDYNECGISKFTVTAEPRETPSLEGAWPWQVYLEIYKSRARVSGAFTVCGGTLLRNDIILTAAHCVANFTTLDATVGVTNRHDEAPGGKLRAYLQPSDVIIHEDYNNRTFSHDIALINLTQPFELTPYVRPACLPDPTKEHRLLHRGVGIMSGWGHGEPVSPNAPLDESEVRPVDNLQHLPLPLQTRDECEETLAGHKEEDWFDATMTCAGYDRKALGACRGDSGGPLVKRASSEGRRAWTVIGITSWGRGCAVRGEFDFFTNVPHHVPWIERKMSEAAAPAQ